MVAPPPSAAPPPGYREAIEQALSEYDAHNYAEARAAFLRAHALYPNARTLRGLGMMEFELRNYIESISLLEQALASQVKPLATTLRAQTDVAPSGTARNAATASASAAMLTAQTFRGVR